MARSDKEEPLRPEYFLQLYTYYGAISWQIFATFIAAALVVFFIPFADTTGIFRNSRLIFSVNCSVAIGLAGVGLVIFLRYQYFAHRWIHNQFSPPWLEERISSVEWRQPYNPEGHKEPITAWPRPLGFMWKITKRIPPRYHFTLVLLIPSGLALVDVTLLVCAWLARK